MKSFKFGFCFANWIVGSEVGFKFRNERLKSEAQAGIVGSNNLGLKHSNAEPFK